MAVDRKKLHTSALVLVLGAVSQSPRMQYHASSLLSHGYTITFVGYPRDEVFEGLQAGVKSGMVKVRTVEEKVRMWEMSSSILSGNISTVRFACRRAKYVQI